jgi:uncharacterized protein (TIGR00255 family)
MLRSMTGFGASTSAAARKPALRVEVRSVNHRHLAVKIRLPEGQAALEADVEKRVRARCARGSVSVNISAEVQAGAEGVSIDHELAGRYGKELEGLARKLGMSSELSLEALLALPGVVGLGRSNGVALDQRELLRLVDEALEHMLEMRTAEGQALAADLRKNARALEQLAARIAKRMPRVVRAHRKSLEERVSELLGDKFTLSQGDLAREIALLADKLDISEELSRLESHMQQFESFLKKGGRVGRQLDFLVQELFREVNTIGSKCSDATIAHWVVEAKACVERLREQVQNVE